MGTRRILAALVVGLGLVMGLLWLLGASPSDGVYAQGPDGNDTYYVDLAGTCGGMTPCFDSAQDAVDAVDDPGDVVKVAAGTYLGVTAREGVTQVVYISKTVTIRGGYTTTNWQTADPDVNLTTLDAQGQGRVLYISGDISPTVEGLRITGGDAAGLGGGFFGFDCGGGVYLDHYDTDYASTLNNNQVFSNTAFIGGGVCLYFGAPTLNGNAVFSNTASDGGGGLWLDRSEATLVGNTIASNTADNSGGGLYLLWSGTDTLDDNTILSNTAAAGGGLYLDGVPAVLSGNIIRGNVANGTNWWEGGGGLQMRDSASTFTNNVVTDNQASSGSGLKIRGGSPRLLHTTMARNSGGSGIYIMAEGGDYASAALTNTILVNHSVGISVTGGNTLTVSAVLWYGTPITVSQSVTAVVTVQSQQEGDPAFTADGYHLRISSAAIDEGVDGGVTSDIDGDARPMGPRPDLGADEVWRQLLYLPVVVRNAP